jgi:periplasmic copper chaperone A
MRFKAVLLSIAMAALAAPAHAGDLTVSDAWFRALPTGLPAGGYFTIENSSAKNMVLTSAESASCGMTMLHKTETTGGMSRMDMVQSVVVPAHGTLAFAPGGYHIMCMEPTPEMSPGSTVSVTLHFADGTKLDVKFDVKGPTGQ